MIDFETSKFSAPIPGMSLTTDPKAHAWEKPAKYADPEEALKYYIDKISSSEVLNKLTDILESNFPATDLVDSLILGGIMKGIHSIDVGIIISPALFTFIIGIGKMMEVEVKTGLERDDTPDEGMLNRALKEDVPEDSKEQEMLAKVVDESIEAIHGGIMSKPTDEEEVPMQINEGEV